MRALLRRGGDPLGEPMTVVMMSSWARPAPGISSPRTPHGATLMPSPSAGGAVLDGYHNRYPTSSRNPAFTCVDGVGGTSLKLVSSSASGRSPCFLDLPL